MSTWSIDLARTAYSIPHWAEGYFDVGQDGRMLVRPHGEHGAAVALADVVDAACTRGAQLPLLVRFPDILTGRLHALQGAFARSQAGCGYRGGYTAVYPVKVNQHAGVAGTLAAHHGDGFGLEAGSKPELMAVIALSRPGGIIICNGYKDRDYIRLALIARKLGLQTFIVIEKPSELPLVLQEAAALDMKPVIGVRMRLASLGAGKWQNSGGDTAKFGLSPRQLLTLWKTLRDGGVADILQLLHFHMGSQISNLRDIAAGLREATRYFVELTKLGANITHLDVGGGLGVDYEGTRSRSFCSVNYGIDGYAAQIVGSVQAACREHGLHEPRIITECGRAMTAHHAVLVSSVVDVEPAPEGRIPDHHADEPLVVSQLRAIHSALGQRPPLELWHEARQLHQDGLSAYAHGQIDLVHRARLDDLLYAIAHAVRARLNYDEKHHRAALDELAERLVDKYFVNFSVFESMPDVWAIDQIFPIVPLERLGEPPTRRGVIVDLTCDSDGKIDAYVENEGLDSSLPLHAVNQDEPYRLGFFLVGAYQEILGDIHNLFGDTDAVEVRMEGDSYRIQQQRRGDTTQALLEYVGYSPDTLRASYRRMAESAGLDPDQTAHLIATLDAGLAGYPYLSAGVDLTSCVSAGRTGAPATASPARLRSVRR